MNDERRMDGDKFVEFVGLPTALENANGAQIRCVAITEE